MLFLRVTFALVLGFGGLFAAPVPGRFIVELQDEPVVSGKQRLAAVRGGQERLRQEFSRAGVQVIGAVQTVANALIVEAASEADLPAISGVRKVYQVHSYKPLLDRAVALMSVTDGWSLAGGFENAGRGVKIGIIDTGIDATHPGFQDADLRPPDGFPKVSDSADLSNTNNKVIVARNYARAIQKTDDREGHGTSVAMIAGGGTVSSAYGVLTGVAPKAWLGNYKVFSDSTGSASTDAILRALDDAVADGMDIVNLSLGSFPSELPENDILVRAVERAVASGVIVTVAAGNSGPHAATIGSPGTAPSAITVGNARSDRTFISTVLVDGFDGPLLAKPADGMDTHESISGPLRSVTDLDPSGLACSTLPAGSLAGQVALILRGVCFFEEKLRFVQAAGGIAAVIYTHEEEPEAITMDIGNSSLPAIMLSHADGLRLRSKLQSERVANVSLNFVAPKPVDSRALGTSSSRGPSVDAAIKPEILGIGTDVVSAIPGRKFAAANGTSLSSPMIAGALAILKHGRPGLRNQDYRSLIVNSGTEFTYGGTAPAPVQESGAGLLNVAAAMRSVIAAFPYTINFGSGTADINKAVSFQLTNVGSAPDSFTLSVNAIGQGVQPFLSHTSLSLTPGASQTVSLRLDGSGIAPGAYQGFVVVRSATSDSTARIPYWYGVPGTEVASIAIGDLAGDPNASANETIYVRPSDSLGLPVDARVTAEVIDGGGRVRSISRSGWAPGFWQVDVRLGSTPAANIFEIRAGEKTVRVTLDSR